MSDKPQSLRPDAPLAGHGAALPFDRDSWLQSLEELTEEDGYIEPLGAKHWALFIDDTPKLLVTFERLEDISARPDHMPLGYEMAMANGWSLLSLVCEGETWFRDERVYRYFDRLIDDAFFEDFDQVLFYGADSEGYAAAAFAVSAPGTNVLAICPRASQDPEIAGWDRRDLKARRLDFSSRYGYAPDMVDGAGRVAVVYDPYQVEDAMHAALFRGPHVARLRTAHLNGRVGWSFNHMQILQPLLSAAMAGNLDAVTFAKVWRARRNFGPYLRGLLQRAEAHHRPDLEKMICRNVNGRLQAPRFRKRLADLMAAEALAAADH